MKVKFKQEHFNPKTLRAKGVRAKIKEVTMVGDEVVIDFDEEPSQADIAIVLAFLNRERWVVEI